MSRRNVIDKLFESYRSDKEPFEIDITKRFPERSNGYEEIALLKGIFFPNYWNNGRATKDKDELNKQVDRLTNLFQLGIRPYLEEDITEVVIEQLPNIRDRLKKDVEAGYKGDPAAKTYTEIIRAYPGFSAIEVQRVAHELYLKGAASYARELTENVHSKTGIDIHPGAKIGDYFFIDHGTGVVIGETTEIGDWVRIYQGVTLGVMHFEKKKDGSIKKDYKRHPTIGDHVVIGAGARILGPVTIGDHVNVGANSWVTENVPSKTTVFIGEHPKLEKKQNGNYL